MKGVSVRTCLRRARAVKKSVVASRNRCRVQAHIRAPPFKSVRGRAGFVPPQSTHNHSSAFPPQTLHYLPPRVQGRPQLAGQHTIALAQYCASALRVACRQGPPARLLDDEKDVVHHGRE